MTSRFVGRSVGELVLVVALVGALLVFAGPSTSRAAPTKVFSPRLLARVPSSTTDYLATQDPCSKKFCLGLFRSTNTGKSFVPRTAPPVAAANGNPTGSLDRLAFANDSVGYAVVGQSSFNLYATRNGARSWHKVTTMPRKNWYDLVVTSHLIYVTTDRCTDHGDSCGDFRVWRSSTGGQRWSVLPALWRTGKGANEAYYGPSVAAYGNDVWELETAPPGNYLWTSHDGGRTFVRVTTPELVSVAGCDLTPISSEVLWAECPTGMEVSFLHSSDGGAHWTHVSQHQYGGTAGGDFDPVSSEVAYLDYGGPVKPPNLYRLSDGGRQAMSVGELNCTDVSLAFTNTSDGLAICDQNYSTFSLARTSDGGEQWSHEVIYGN